MQRNYKKEFLQKAIAFHKEGMPSKEIFMQAGFDLDIIGKSAPTTCLGNWSHQDRIKTKSATKYLVKETKKIKPYKLLLKKINT